MYQLMLDPKDIDDLYSDFVNFCIKRDEYYESINLKFFERLVSYFKKDINYAAVISGLLDKDLCFDQLSIMAQCILKVAILESEFEETDAPVIINEYLDISKEFLDNNTAKFMNVLLDKVVKHAKRSRSSEG